MVCPSIISAQIWVDMHLHLAQGQFFRMGLNPFAPLFLVLKLAEVPVIRGQMRILLSSVIPGTVVCGACPSCGSHPTNTDYFDGPALAELSPLSQGGWCLFRQGWDMDVSTHSFWV